MHCLLPGKELGISLTSNQKIEADLKNEKKTLRTTNKAIQDLIFSGTPINSNQFWQSSLSGILGLVHILVTTSANWWSVFSLLQRTVVLRISFFTPLAPLLDWLRFLHFGCSFKSSKDPSFKVFQVYACFTHPVDVFNTGCKFLGVSQLHLPLRTFILAASQQRQLATHRQHRLVMCQLCQHVDSPVLAKHKNREILHCRNFRSPSTIVTTIIGALKKYFQSSIQ